LVALIEGRKSPSEPKTTTGLALEHSSWEVTDDSVQLFNYWNMGMDADSLTYAELRLPDTPAYARYERLIVDEVKDIVVPVSLARRPPSREELARDGLTRNDLRRGGYVYLRAAYSVRTTHLAEFAARLEASLTPFARHYGWYDGQAYIGITGRSGSIVQLWIIPESAVRLAENRLAAAHWQELLRHPPSCRFLEPTPTDPILRAAAAADDLDDTQQLAAE
jgi:hypothetical protein